MSDIVKLIIEIPKDYYEALSKTKEIISSQRSGKTFMSVIYSAVAHGTPLDEVKAEIDEQYDRIRPYNIYVAEGLEMALEILDNIGKAESEE